MIRFPRVATLFIASCALSTGAMAQKTIYRCGSSYSQVPCEGAVSVDASDARTRTDKTAADKATQRDMKQATAMEKTRIKEEKEAVAQAQAAHKASEKSAAKAQDKPEANEHEKKKAAKHKKKEPEFFTAKAAPEKKKD
ncbi:MAG: hypothetical protein KGN32_15035 [Burkholderiales bacterium]|nr:hypothetical protein [Burkholderiales bacterium]